MSARMSCGGRRQQTRTEIGRKRTDRCGHGIQAKRVIKVPENRSNGEWQWCEMSLVEDGLNELRERKLSLGVELESSPITYRLPQVCALSVGISHPDGIPHHPPHHVLAEDDNLLGEVANSTRIAAESDVRHLCQERLDQRFGEGRTREEVGGPGIGGAGNEEEAGVCEKGSEFGEEGSEGGEKLYRRRRSVNSTHRGSHRPYLGIPSLPRRRTGKADCESCRRGQRARASLHRPSLRTPRIAFPERP